MDGNIIQLKHGCSPRLKIRECSRSNDNTTLESYDLFGANAIPSDDMDGKGSASPREA